MRLFVEKLCVNIVASDKYFVTHFRFPQRTPGDRFTGGHRNFDERGGETGGVDV